ncbi:hypothetical protein B0H10DRAFT_862427 [Mycena sp. CBHHK59/15]|nr:hypothetical protein B0H10DRAFT_862427 [Mycena sp. CBHHK59/15]
MSRILALAVAALSLRYVAAETSLVIPFVDPQAISADILGVDSAKTRTTWALHQGAPTGIYSTEQGDEFPGTATLIEGTDYASFTYVAAAGGETITAGGECTIAGGNEICVAAAGGTTITNTDSALPFAIQGGTTAVLAASATAAPSGGRLPVALLRDPARPRRRSRTPRCARRCQPLPRWRACFWPRDWLERTAAALSTYIFYFSRLCPCSLSSCPTHTLVNCQLARSLNFWDDCKLLLQPRHGHRG